MVTQLNNVMKRQPKEFHPTFEIVSNSREITELLIERSLKRRIKLMVSSFERDFPDNSSSVETPYHDNDLILTPIISPQSGWQGT